MSTFPHNASVHKRHIHYPDPSQDLVFQITEMEALNKPAFPADSEGFVPPQTTLCFFGETKDGTSVTLALDHYKPSFLAECDKFMTGARIDIAFNKLKSELGWRGKFISKGTLCYGHTLKGFTNDEKIRFLRVYCASDDILKTCLRISKDSSIFRTFDGRLEPILRFTHEANITASGWVRIKGGTYSIHDEERVTTSLDISAPFSSLTGVNQTDIARCLVFSFDIEAYSASGEFPEPEQDPVIQIGCTLWWTDETEETNIIFVLDSCGSLPSAEVRCFSDEGEMLMAWRDFFVESDPDFVTGYNITSFDFSYLIKRAERLGRFDFCRLGRFKHEECRVKKEHFESQAYGYKEFNTVKMSGRTIMDMLTLITRGPVKLTSYKLDFVAQHFLGDRKEDMPYDELFRLHREGGHEGRTKVASYCVHDARLPLRLMRHLYNLPHMTEMSRVTGVSINWLSTRGQSIKAKNQISRMARQYKYYIPDNWKDSEMFAGNSMDDEKYKGATVLEAQVGAYLENPVAGLDFARLYPTIMIAHNLSFETLVLSDQFMNIEDVKYKSYTVEDGTKYTFVQKTEKKTGLIPLILEELGAARKRAKREMNACDDPVLKAILDGRQLALKVSANSIYGFTGAKLGPMTCVPIAQVTTCIGREMIEHTKKCAEDWYGGNVVYGDSVTGDTAMVVRRGGTMQLCRMEDLVADESQWYQYHHGKEAANVPDLEVLDEVGWTTVNRVIRHIVTKPLYRVLSHTGVVDCTEDHGLLRANGSKVAPGELNVGDRLLHIPKDTWENMPIQHTDITAVEAEAMGMFAADGSCGEYNCPSGKKYSWAINNSNRDLLEYMATLLPFKTVILDTLASSHVFKLVPVGSIKTHVLRYRRFFYDNARSKRIPEEILFGPLPIASAFFKGFYAGDGDRMGQEKQTCCRMDQKSKTMTMALFILSSRLGWKVSINTRFDKPDIFRLNLTKSYQRRPFDEIKSISPLPAREPAFVYDLETASHHFHVGPGNLVVHNTDSIMVQFPAALEEDDVIDAAMRIGEEAAVRISETFIKPIELEFEKVYLPYYLYKKKRYAGVMYTEKYRSAKYEKIDVKGLEVVRRDNCKLLRDVQKKILDILLLEKDVPKAKEYVTTVLRSLLRGEINIDDLVISKSLSKKNYTNTNLPHVRLAEKIEKRKPGFGPKSGDRVPYVVVKSAAKLPQYEKVEDPQYVLENGLELDNAYYLDHQLATPLTTLLSVVVENPAKFIEQIKREELDKQSGTQYITNFFSSATKRKVDDSESAPTNESAKKSKTESAPKKESAKKTKTVSYGTENTGAAKDASIKSWLTFKPKP